MEDSNPVERDELEVVEELYDFLLGSLPEGVTVAPLPKMTPDQAFTVVWFLQEVSKVFPSSIEQCSCCKNLFDSDRQGHVGDTEESMVCDNCPIPQEGSEAVHA